MFTSDFGEETPFGTGIDPGASRKSAHRPIGSFGPGFGPENLDLGSESVRSLGGAGETPVDSQLSEQVELHVGCANLPIPQGKLALALLVSAASPVKAVFSFTGMHFLSSVGVRLPWKLSVKPSPFRGRETVSLRSFLGERVLVSGKAFTGLAKAESAAPKVARGELLSEVAFSSV